MIRPLLSRLSRWLSGESAEPLPSPPKVPVVEWDPNAYVAAQQRAPMCFACAAPKPMGQVLCEKCIAARARWAS